MPLRQLGSIQPSGRHTFQSKVLYVLQREAIASRLESYTEFEAAMSSAGGAVSWEPLR